MQHNFRKLKIWQLAMEIVDDVYLLTKKYQKDEMFGLTSQSRRAAVAIPSNISEGSGRRTKKDFSNFIDISLSSSNELITQIIVALHQKYITSEESDKLVLKISERQNMTISFQRNNLKEQTD
jgi:four helix bundle protein